MKFFKRLTKQQANSIIGNIDTVGTQGEIILEDTKSSYEAVQQLYPNLGGLDKFIFGIKGENI